MEFAKYWHHLRQAITSAFFLCLGGLMPVASAWSQAETRDQIELHAVEFLDRFTTDVGDLTANFEQNVFDADNELIESSTGKFLLLRPNRFAWYYDTPDELIVVADGESLWMYDVELEQVTRAPLSDLASSPAMLLSGEGSVSDGFRISDGVSDDGRRWIELLPVEDDGDFTFARIAFSDGIPGALELVDGLSQMTRIEFADVDVNSGLRRRDFEFDPPAGVNIVGEDD